MALQAFSLLFVIAVSAFSLISSNKFSRYALGQVRFLEHSIDLHTRDDRGAEEDACACEVAGLVREVFDGENPGGAKLAVGELVAEGAMMRAQVAQTAKGLLRVPVLAGIAAAIVVLASSGLAKTSMVWVLLCLGLGLFASICSQLILARGRRAVRRFVDLVEVLERQFSRMHVEGPVKEQVGASGRA